MTTEDRLAKLERYLSALVYILDYRNIVAPDGSGLVVALERIADDPASSYPNLINVPKPVVVWISKYSNGLLDISDSKQQSDQRAETYRLLNGSDRVFCRRIVIDNPEGFDE